MKIGAHQSIKGGFHKAIESAVQISLETVQLFTKSPQIWADPILDESQIHGFRAARIQAEYEHVVVHASYLVNPCSAASDTRDKAWESLKNEALRCDKLGVDYLVFHPGSPGKLGIEEGIKLTSEGLQYALDESAHVTILVENTAGQGKSIGHRFDHLAQILEQSSQPGRTGVCFDTCHGFAGGYPLAKKSQAIETFNQFDKIVGRKNLKALHLNDSRTGLGSRVDRHERIGKGHIGIELFKWMVKAKRFENIPAILETPIDKNETYKEEADLLKSFR